jgi:hypothetical protein
MQCSTCGFMLPAGAAFCTNCGAKMGNQGIPGSQPAGSSQVEPTIAASSPYGAAPMNPSSNQQAVPPTVYGAPYSTPQQYSYEAPPPPPPANVYGTPPPSNPYGAPYAPPPASFVPPVQQPPTRPKGPNVGLIIGIVVLLLLVVGGGFLAIRAASNGSKTNTTTTPTATTAQSTPTTSITPTPIVTPATGGTVPSAAQVDPAAAAIITKAQTASAIDSNDFPTTLTSSFNAGQTVYVTFNLTTNGQSGYSEARLFSNTTYIGNKILTIQSNFDHGYFTVFINQAATGTVGLYWCTQANCSDAKLATFVTFTVA